MYRKIGFLILGFWFVAIVAALMIGMYEIHRQNQTQIKKSNDLHQTNTITINDLNRKHDELSGKHDKLRKDFDASKSS